MVSDKVITKLLFSSPSKFIGEYENEDILVTHVSDGKIKQREWLGSTENPFSRNFFIIVIKTPKWQRDSTVIPDYSYLGKEFCIGFSVLFGKRFDSHGLLEQHNRYYLPDYKNISRSCSHMLAFNDHKPRIDYDIALDFREVKYLVDIIGERGTLFSILKSVGEYYLKAICEYEHNPEIAFIHLVTCGEILSNFMKHNKIDLIDNRILDDLKIIRENVKDGEKVSNRLLSQFGLVKSKYTNTLVTFLDDEFFDKTQSQNDSTRLLKSNIIRRIKASYDVRSKMLHTGELYNGWIAHSIYSKDEIVDGKPILNNKEYEKLIQLCPTFAGMERIIRYCLIKILCQKGWNISIE